MMKTIVNVDRVGALGKEYFNRGKFKVNELLYKANKYEMNPKRKVKNIHFHVADPEEEMKKAKNMSKESLVFRTQEIKIKMKKKLETVEEILFFLIKENNFKEFKDIIEKYRVSVESKDKKGNSFLLLSVQCGFIDFTKYLLEKGANINSQNTEKNSALHYALMFQNFELVDFLLKNGANENLVNSHNLTPWQCLQC